MNTFPGTGASLLSDDNHNAKPAHYAVPSGLGGGATNTPIPTNTPSTTPMTTQMLTGGSIAVPARTPTSGGSCYSRHDWGSGLTASVIIQDNDATTINSGR